MDYCETNSVTMKSFVKNCHYPLYQIVTTDNAMVEKKNIYFPKYILEHNNHTSLFINLHGLFNTHLFFHSFDIYLLSTYHVLR